MSVDGANNVESVEPGYTYSRSEIIETELREGYTEAELNTLGEIHTDWLAHVGNLPHLTDHLAREVCPSWNDRREFWLRGLVQYAEMKTVRMLEGFIDDLANGQHACGWKQFWEFDNHQSVLERARIELGRMDRTTAQAA